MAKRNMLVTVQGDAEGRSGCPRCWRGQKESGRDRPYWFDVYDSNPEAEQMIELRGAAPSFAFRRVAGPTTDASRNWELLEAKHVRCRDCHALFDLTTGAQINPEDV